MKNKYEIRGNEVIIFLNRRDGQVIETRVSVNKLEKLQGYRGRFNARWNETTKSFYCFGSRYENRKQIRIALTWVIFDIKQGFIGDHFNHDTLDNTDENIRVITISENNQNLKDQRKNNKSGHRGVCWDTRKGKWLVQVRVKGVRVFSRTYDDLKLAIKESKEARSIYSKFSKEYKTLDVVKENYEKDNLRPQTNNKSRQKHIMWNKHRDKWLVQITSLNITRSFDSLEKAIEARDKLLNGENVPIRKTRTKQSA